MDRGIKVGIVANEFFDADINRVGGFGWAGRRAIDSFKSDIRFADPVYFSGESLKVSNPSVDGTRIIAPAKSRLSNLRAAWRESPDILLCIDFRPSYLRWIKLLPRTPVVIWVRDPQTPEAVARLKSLRLPDTDMLLEPLKPWDFHALKRFVGKTRILRRHVVLANKMEYMNDMIPAVYGLPKSGVILPNPDIIDYNKLPAPKSEKPRVISLGRLDPLKRPWLFLELARRFPSVEFLMLGKGFYKGSGAWTPDDVPPNLRLMGNLKGPEKLELLSSAWVLVNTAIHEESAVSMLEALACETPIINFIESDGLSDRFGICLGYDTGSGLTSIPRLSNALDGLLNDGARREELGKSGRQWVMREHNTKNFLSSFESICRTCGVHVGSKSVG